MICRAYSPGWILLARWHMEIGSEESIKQAKAELTIDPAPARFIRDSSHADFVEARAFDKLCA